CARGGNYYGYW
nr:immunoglobulin heavy chain junction region [Mus musculus]